MVQEPSHLKQLSSIHVCKIGFRTENLAVDTRTVCLPPIEFFKITHARKATAGKSRPETTDTAGKSRHSGPWRETFYILWPEKVRPENPGR
jgi:hypothetical protein